MGQPIPYACAAPLCQSVHTTECGGVFFHPQQLFTKPIGASPQVSTRTLPFTHSAVSQPIRLACRLIVHMIALFLIHIHTCLTLAFTFLQLWACCVDHKREALHAILKDLPFRHSKRG